MLPHQVSFIIIYHLNKWSEEEVSEELRLFFCGEKKKLRIVKAPLSPLRQLICTCADLKSCEIWCFPLFSVCYVIAIRELMQRKWILNQVSSNRIALSLRTAFHVISERILGFKRAYSLCQVFFEESGDDLLLFADLLPLNDYGWKRFDCKAVIEHQISNSLEYKKFSNVACYDPQSVLINFL